MPALADILRRFRFHGVPGAPAAGGVPVDRMHDMEVELAPVFAALDEDQRKAKELVAVADAAAARRRMAAHEHAQRIVNQAHAEAGVARADAAAAHLTVAARERARLLAAGSDEAERVRLVASHRVPVLAAETVARVLSALVASSALSPGVCGRPDESPGRDAS